MAEREMRIIAGARITLNDLAESLPRWSNTRLVSLLSDAQEEMCKGMPLLTRKATINTVAGQEEYRLPIDSISLIRASSEGIALPLISYDVIERSNAGWEDDKGNAFTSIIVNALSQQTIRPYPLISASKPLKVRYQALPERITYNLDDEDTNEELTIDSMWDVGLKQYIVAMAFLDYGDPASISRSQVAMGLYNKEFQSAKSLSKKSFSKNVRTTDFQAKVSNQNTGGRYGRGNCRFGY